MEWQTVLWGLALFVLGVIAKEFLKDLYGKLKALFAAPRREVPAPPSPVIHVNVNQNQTVHGISLVGSASVPEHLEPGPTADDASQQSPQVPALRLMSEALHSEAAASLEVSPAVARMTAPVSPGTPRASALRIKAIREDIKAAPLLHADEVRARYVGLPVRWWVSLYSISAPANPRIMAYDADDQSVCFNVKREDYPELVHLRAGAGMTVRGVIEEVSHSVYLQDAVIESFDEPTVP